MGESVADRLGELGPLTDQAELLAQPMHEQPLMNRTQEPGSTADPIRQGRTIEVDPLPGVDLGLPVERKVIGVLGHQHLGDRRLGR